VLGQKCLITAIIATGGVLVIDYMGTINGIDIMFGVVGFIVGYLLRKGGEHGR